VAETRKYLWENRLDDYAPEAITEMAVPEGMLPAELDAVPEPVQEEWDKFR